MLTPPEEIMASISMRADARRRRALGGSTRFVVIAGLRTASGEKGVAFIGKTLMRRARRTAKSGSLCRARPIRFVGAR